MWDLKLPTKGLGPARAPCTMARPFVFAFLSPTDADRTLSVLRASEKPTPAEPSSPTRFLFHRQETRSGRRPHYLARRKRNARPTQRPTGEIVPSHSSLGRGFGGSGPTTKGLLC